MSDFVHLHVHSQYSLLDGLSNLNDLAERVKSHGQTAVALTDHGAMYGAVHFFNICKSAGIKPIIGVEAYMSETSRFDKQVKPGADQYHITLLAKTDLGYRNLMQLVSLANLEGFSYKPRIDIELLKKFHRGIIATTGCSSGIVPKKLLQKKPQEARAWLSKLYDIFDDDLYVEIQAHPKLKDVEWLRDELVKLAQEFGLPLVATNDVHYVDKDDAEAQDALLAVQLRKTIADKDRMSIMGSPDFYLRSTDEMAKLFARYPEALANTVKIAESCNVTIPTGKMIFPLYPLENYESEELALRAMSHERLKQRFPHPSKEALLRLDYELDIICSKGYASYFLIVQDFVNWAKNQGIGVGPGRGSAAGSLVSYSLRITDIDPLKHVIPFERFMNPQRPSPPDIDIDIADVRRDEVIRFVAEKYGEDHVAQVITFGTMEARAAIRDIGRALGMPYSDPDRIAKLVPPGIKLKQAIEEVAELKQTYQDPQFTKLLDLAMKVEGSARHHSVHAAAVVIADKPLTHYTPIQRESKGGKIVTQYDMYSLDLNIDEGAIGLLKMDFLGLRNLSILSQSIEFVKKRSGEEIDLTNIPLDDQKVYEMLSQGETTGVFQLESGGMRRVARSLKPSRFTDITAMVALYRPGPMELIDDFIKGKNQPETVVYPHDDLKPVLEETYGIPVYQEQVLQIANVFAGYSLGEADILRRAIGKKKKSILDKEKKRFVRGAVDKGYTKDKAEEIWGFIDKFAGYGFNKAHSASYGMIAYQTAYMKVNYPIEYMAALLSIESGSHSSIKDEKVSQAIDECKRMGIVVLPPDINLSQAGFSIEKYTGSLLDQAIRFGFNAVKNVGEAAIEAILTERSSGIFTSFTSFCHRVDNRKVNKKVFESLIKVGAFDSFANRATLYAHYDSIRQHAGKRQVELDSGQTSLFDMTEPDQDTPKIQKDDFEEREELPIGQLLAGEKELLGVFISQNPLHLILDQLKTNQSKSIESLDPILHHNQVVTLMGIITKLRQIVTKLSGKEMAFATLEDTTGFIELVLFPKIYQQAKTYISLNSPFQVIGRFESRDDNGSILVDTIEPIQMTQPSLTSDKHNISNNQIVLPVALSSDRLKAIGSVLQNNKGSSIIEIVIDLKTDNRFTWPHKINWNQEVKLAISKCLN